MRDDDARTDRMHPAPF